MTQPNRNKTALYELERQTGAVRDRVRDVAARRRASFYIFGPRGTGKTHLVRQTLDDIEEPFHYHTGHVTPLGYFDLLKEHAQETVVLDDVTTLFKTPIGQQMLLASLGTSSGEWTRIIRYQRRGIDEVVRFSGGVIAISNIAMHDGDTMAAIKSRTRPLRWNPSDTQLELIMRQAVQEGWSTKDVVLTAEECSMVVDFIVAQARLHGASLDIRLLFDTALPDYVATKQGEHEVDWRDHTLMGLMEQVTRLEFTGPPPTREQRLQLERKIAEKIRASHNTRREQVEAWTAETGKSDRAYDRRCSELRIAP